MTVLLEYIDKSLHYECHANTFPINEYANKLIIIMYMQISNAAY